VGRQLDVIRTPDGRLIPGEFFPHLLKDFPAVRRFQVVQEEADRVTVRLVATHLPKELHRQLEPAIRQRLGPGMRLEIERVEHIPLTAAGKLQVVVNRVPQRKVG
jgi:phenylacetate-CoA ligase